jgi:hypothetical protein
VPKNPRCRREEGHVEGLPRLPARVPHLVNEKPFAVLSQPARHSASADPGPGKLPQCSISSLA